MTKDREMNKEVKILRLSLMFTIIFAIAGVAVAIICDSLTMMLDGLYGVADVIISLLAIFVVRKINEPPNDKYHFGYAKFEPLMTSIEGTLVMAICAGSIVASIQDIIHNDPIKNIPVVLWYSLISTFMCIGCGLYMKSKSKMLKSRIIEVYSRIWVMEGFLSAAVFLAFGSGFLFPESIFNRFENYTDPVMCILISLILLKEPINILKDGFLDLVDATPGKKLDLEIRSFAQDSAQKYGLIKFEQMKIRKAGRKIFAYILFKADQNANIKELNDIRNHMNRDMNKINENIELVVLF